MLRKRIISLLLSGVMLFSFFNITAMAAEGEGAQSGDLVYGNWHFNDGQLPAGITKDGTYPYEIKDGVLILQTQSNALGRIIIDKVTNKEAVRPDFVLEFKNRLSNMENYAYMSWRAASSAPMFFYGAQSYSKDRNAWGWFHNNAAVAGTIDDVTKWHTYAIKYSGTDNTRSLYIDGVLAGTTDSDVNSWFETGSIVFNLMLYSKSCVMTSEYDYIRTYSPGTKVGIKAYPMSYSLDKVYVEFDTTIVDFSKDMITVDGITAESVTLFDEENQVFEVKLSENLQTEQTYDVVINGAKTSLGKIVSDTISFTTRDKTFYVDGPKVTDGTNEMELIIPGSAKVLVNVADELDEGRSVEVMAAQYDAEGFMIKDSFFNKTTANGQADYDVEISFDAQEISAFSWDGIDNPVPVSDVTTYSMGDKENIKLGYKMPEYTGEAEVTAAIKEDYSGLTVAVDTKDSVERIVGLLIKYKDNVEYVDNKLTEGGKAVFDIPLKEENVGDYSIAVGIEKGKKISVTPDIEYYSPSYIEQMMETKINSDSANASTVGEFVAALGEYMKLDTKSLDKVSDKDYAFDRLLSLRSAEENQTIASKERFATLFKTAVKMACIYEGIDTEKLINESEDLAITGETKNTFGKLISRDAKAYVVDNLKGTAYNLPTDIAEDVKKLSIIGGIYKASHNSILASLIDVYGTELGIDTQNYYTLSDPSKVADKVIKVEYPSLSDFKDAVNSAITEQKNNEAVIQPPPPVVIRPSGGGGGGGGGISYSPIPAEDKKEEEKPAVKKSYSDVTAGDWFFDDVMWATENGWFIGTSDTTFSPENYLTWEHIAIVLSRIGFEYTTTRGSENILRGDFANLLYEFMADQNKYKNVNEWIEGTKMFIGNDSGNMMFDTPLTRAQCCTLIRRIENK